MSDTPWTIQDAFDPVELDAWRKRLDQDLKGRPFEKLMTRLPGEVRVKPLYTEEDWRSDRDDGGFPGQGDLRRGAGPLGNFPGGWEIRQRYVHPDPAEVARRIKVDLARGVDSVELVFGDSPTQRGLHVDGVEDLSVALADIALQTTHVALAGPGNDLAMVGALLALTRMRGIKPTFFAGLDPISQLAATGRWETSVERQFDYVSALSRYAHRSGLERCLAVDTSVYHHAGAGVVQDLAFALATGVEYMRQLNDRKLDLSGVADQITFRFRLGSAFFLEIARLRAARVTWTRVLEACGVEPEDHPMHVCVAPSMRVITRRDPNVNMLRNLSAVFAGALGGADVIVSAPFDAALGPPSPLARRVARNTQLVLAHESHLGKVIDPMGGSWFMESLTDQLSEAAWETFQTIESEGGMLAALRSGWIGARVTDTGLQRERDISRRNRLITGVSAFPDLDEDTPAANDAEPPDTLPAADNTHIKLNEAASLVKADPDDFADALIEACTRASLTTVRSALAEEGESVVIDALELRPLAEGWEDLRTRSDAILAATGSRPRVLMILMGEESDYRTRADWTTNALAAGGIDVAPYQGELTSAALDDALDEADTDLALLCGSNWDYDEEAAGAVKALKRAGAEVIILAGRPGRLARELNRAGLTHAIFLGTDILGLLTDLLEIAESNLDEGGQP